MGRRAQSVRGACAQHLCNARARHAEDVGRARHAVVERGPWNFERGLEQCCCAHTGAIFLSDDELENLLRKKLNRSK